MDQLNSILTSQITKLIFEISGLGFSSMHYYFLRQALWALLFTILLSNVAHAQASSWPNSFGGNEQASHADVDTDVADFALRWSRRIDTSESEPQILGEGKHVVVQTPSDLIVLDHHS